MPSLVQTESGGKYHSREQEGKRSEGDNERVKERKKERKKESKRTKRREVGSGLWGRLTVVVQAALPVLRLLLPALPPAVRERAVVPVPDRGERHDHKVQRVHRRHPGVTVVDAGAERHVGESEEAGELEEVPAHPG